jgi:hypothetical protein
MDARLDRAWAEFVCSICDPICDSAAVGFARQIHEDPDRGVTAVLWEADPRRFAERYADSGIVESYGPDQWPPPCIDYWVYVDAETRQARFSLEGPGPDDDVLTLTGDGHEDGLAIGHVLARVLDVPGPAG